MERSAKARDVMVAEVITLLPESSLLSAWELFSRNQISGAPVVTEAGDLVGVVSQADLLREAMTLGSVQLPVSSYYIGLPYLESELPTDVSDRFAEALVEDVMRTSVITVSPDEDVASVAVKFRLHKVHRLIVTEGERVVGIVSTLDMLRMLENH